MFVRILLQKHPQNTQESDGTPNFGHICFKKLNSLWILRMSRMIKRLGRIQQRFTSPAPSGKKDERHWKNMKKENTISTDASQIKMPIFFKWPSPNSPQPNTMGNVPARMVPHVARCAPVTMWGWSWKAPSSGRRVLQGADVASSALQVSRLTPKPDSIRKDGRGCYQIAHFLGFKQCLKQGKWELCSSFRIAVRWIFINFYPEILDRIPFVFVKRLFFAREKLEGHRCTGDTNGSIPGFWHVFLWLADMLQQLTRWCYLKGAFPSWTWKQLTNYSRPIEVFTSPSNLLTKLQFFSLILCCS